MAQLKMYSLLGFSILYPDQIPPDRTDLASKIGRELLLQGSCYFLSYFRLSAVPSLDDLLKEWFTFNEYTYAENPNYPDVADRLKKVREDYPHAHIEMLVVESFLRLFSWLLEHPELPDQVDNIGPATCLPLLQLYLLFNDDVLAGLAHGRQSVEKPKDDRHFIRLTLVNAFPSQDFMNVDYAQLLMTQFYKAGKLFDFLSSDPLYAPLLAKFLETMRCANMDEYFSRLGPAVIGSVMKQTPGWTELNVTPGPNYDTDCEFLEQLAVRSDASPEAKENDFLQLRSNPLHEVGKGKYRVIYDAFMIKKVYYGFIFQLFALARQNKTLFAKDLPGTVRDEFSEGTLVYEMLAQIFDGQRTVKISGKQFKEVKLPTEPDYYVRVDSTVLLVESKDFYMKGEEKLSHDFPTIRAGLENGRLGKAVKQLATNIERVILGTMPLDRYNGSTPLTVMPVIIVHDALYSAPGLNYWVHYWLEAELIKVQEKIGKEKFQSVQLFPVTLVEIDTLILYLQHFINKQLDMIQLMQTFQRNVGYGYRNFRTAQEADAYARKSVLPFAKFVRDYGHHIKLELDHRHIDAILMKYGMRER